MNSTERGIVEQFKFWDSALSYDLPGIDKNTIVVVGCGTSFYLAQTIAATFNQNRRQALAVPSAEWVRRPDAYLADRSNVSVIALSRSGETTETIEALEASRSAGMPTFGITCAKDSTLTKVSDRFIYLPTHEDEGVVMTSSASLMLLVGLRMAGAELPETIGTVAQSAMAMLDAFVPKLLEGRSHFVYLAGGALYGLASEGALKLQEMSLSYAQSFHPMEYRHGPVSLVDEKTLVVMLYNEDTLQEEAKLVRELQEKGAVVIGLGGPGNASVPFDATGSARALAMLPALQILGERVAEGKAIDTTAPRHLSKVVLLA